MDVRIFKVEVNLCGDISRYYVKFSLEDNEKFEDLKEKIVSRVSGLSDKEFKILWIGKHFSSSFGVILIDILIFQTPMAMKFQW